MPKNLQVTDNTEVKQDDSEVKEEDLNNNTVNTNNPLSIKNTISSSLSAFEDRGPTNFLNKKKER